MELTLSSDMDDIEWVLKRMLYHAKQEYQTMYLIVKNGFYVMTDNAPMFKDKLATVYPGGRILLRGRTNGLQHNDESKEIQVVATNSAPKKTTLATEDCGAQMTNEERE